MVYESDFYTTRRPYSRPSTYTSTAVPLRYIPAYGKIHTISAFYPTRGPLLTQRRLISRVAPHSVVTIRVRPSVVIRELDRIEHRSRPHVGYSASENFLCSNSNKEWEDETKRIRVETASIMQRIHAAVPRASSVVPYSTYARYNEPYLPPSKYTSENYLRGMIMPVRNVARDIESMSWYSEPAKRFTGRGHLACIRYSGAKGFPNRRALCQDLSVKDDVTLLSFYAKNRLAANGLALESVTVKLLPDRPSRKFQAPQLLEDPGKELKAYKAERLDRFRTIEASPAEAAAEAERTAERKKKRQEEAKLAEERALAEELARKKELAKKEEAARAAELARQEELAAQAAAERSAEIERKAEIARQADAERQAIADAARLEEEKKAEEARLIEEAKMAEEAKIAEEARQAEEARLAEEAKLAEEARHAEEARLAEEARIAEEERQKELARLEEIEKQAAEEKEAELASQAAELAEIARQESELAALAKQEAELAELERQEAELAAAEGPEPQVEEPETPEIEEPAAEAEEASESHDVAEAEVTEDEEE